MRLPRCLLVPGSAALMAGALTLIAGTGFTSPAQASHVAYPARFAAAAGASLARYLRHYRPRVILAGHAHTGPDGTVAAQSFNWSGYADGSETTTAGTFTAVSGSWTAPSVTCSAEDQITTDWVGLDGLFSSSAEQLGTMAWCYEGSPLYYTWWEMYPTDSSFVVVGTKVQPGDKISASVTRSGSKYTLKLTDATTPVNSFTIKQSCPASTCPDTSAEWISERPAFDQVGIAPLAHYNAFKITNGAQTSSGKAGTIGSFATVEQIIMRDAVNMYNLNGVSSLSSKKNSFSTTWRNSY